MNSLSALLRLALLLPYLVLSASAGIWDHWYPLDVPVATSATQAQALLNGGGACAIGGANLLAQDTLVLRSGNRLYGLTAFANLRVAAGATGVLVSGVGFEHLSFEPGATIRNCTFRGPMGAITSEGADVQNCDFLDCYLVSFVINGGTWKNNRILRHTGHDHSCKIDWTGNETHTGNLLVNENELGGTDGVGTKGKLHLLNVPAFRVLSGDLEFYNNIAVPAAAIELKGVRHATFVNLSGNMTPATTAGPVRSDGGHLAAAITWLGESSDAPDWTQNGAGQVTHFAPTASAVVSKSGPGTHSRAFACDGPTRDLFPSSWDAWTQAAWLAAFAPANPGPAFPTPELPPLPGPPPPTATVVNVSAATINAALRTTGRYEIPDNTVVVVDGSIEIGRNKLLIGHGKNRSWIKAATNTFPLVVDDRQTLEGFTDCAIMDLTLVGGTCGLFQQQDINHPLGYGPDYQGDWVADRTYSALQTVRRTSSVNGITAFYVVRPGLTAPAGVTPESEGSNWSIATLFLVGQRLRNVGFVGQTESGWRIRNVFGLDNNMFVGLDFVDTPIGFDFVADHFGDASDPRVCYCDKTSFYLCRWVRCSTVALNIIGYRACGGNSWISCRFEAVGHVCRSGSFSNTLFADCDIVGAGTSTPDANYGGAMLSGNGYFNIVNCRITPTAAVTNIFDTEVLNVEGCTINSGGNPACRVIGGDAAWVTYYGHPAHAGTYDGRPVLVANTTSALPLLGGAHPVRNLVAINNTFPAGSPSGRLHVRLDGVTQVSDTTPASPGTRWWSQSAAPPLAPVIAADPLFFTVGRPGYQNLTATHGAACFDVAGLPAGLALDATSGRVTGTPTAAGNSTLAVAALNDGGVGAGETPLEIHHPTPSAPADPRALVVAPANFPWARASTATLRAHGPRVLAHYMGTHTMQRYIPDDLGLNYHVTEYQDVFGEGGKHRTYGGLERTGPLWKTSRYPVSYAALEAARLADCEDEIREMIAAGIDGIVLNIQGGPGAGAGDEWAVNHWAVSRRIVQAAHNVDPGFVVLVSPDMHTWFGEHPEDWLAVARWAATLPNAYRLPDGRLVLGTYEPWAHDAPWWTDTWWANTLATLAGEGISIAWWPTFNGCHSGHGRPDGISPVNKWSHLAHGFMEWGDRAAASAYSTNSASGEAVHAAGRAFAAPVGSDYLRTPIAMLQEAEASRGLREAWRAARDLNAEIVQLCTWNDYHEHAAIAPTGAGQWNWLQHHAWEIQATKLAAAPTVTEDRLVLFHRSQLATAPVSRQTTNVNPAGKSDLVELVAYLAAPGTLEIVQGSRVDTLAGVAGRNVLHAPAQPGATPVARLRRADGSSLTLASRTTIRSAVEYQDLVYRGTDSTDLARTTRVPPDTYAAWRAASFGADATNDALAGPQADPEETGVTNFQRYAHGLPARGPVANPVKFDTVTTDGSTRLRLTFPRRATGAGLSYVVESSPDLVTWTPVPGRTYGPGTDPVLVPAKDVVALGDAGTTRRFLRLRVASP